MADLPAASRPSAGPAPDADPPASAPRRAGRDLPAAVAVGLALGGVVVGSLALRRWAFGCLVVPVASGLGIWETVRALRQVGARPALPPLLLGGSVTIVAAHLRGSEALLFGLVATVLACLVWLLGEGTPGFLRDFTASAFVAVYLPFLAAFVAMLATPDDGARRVVGFLATAVCSDVGGYATGVLAGRHRMAPTVSPKKSWEGLGGSAVACLVCGVAVVSTLVDVAWWQGALFGLAVVAAATIGDLGESLVKRDVGVKDMGRLLPGHGGIMDRADSVLLAAPVAWLLLSAWAPAG